MANTKEIDVHYNEQLGKWVWNVNCLDEDGNIVRRGHGREDSEKKANKKANGFVCSTGGGTGTGIGTGNSWTYVGENGETFEVTITPPKVNASIIDGHLEYSEIINPWTNEFHRFTSNEISQNELAWLTGLCFFDGSLSEEHKLVATMLKVLGVYLGGNSTTEIMSLHNLTAEQFEAIATKSWESATITQTEKNDGTVHLDWNFEY